jgi:hypothetical protein
MPSILDDKVHEFIAQKVQAAAQSAPTPMM